MIDPAEAAARQRWRAADDRLYPTLINNPAGYQRALTDIQAVVAELRTRGDDTASLVAAEADPDALVAAAGVTPAGIPVDLLVGVACGVRDRELSAARERDRVQHAIASARAAGQDWVRIHGPAAVTDLADGRHVELHLPTGTTLTATVDAWSGGPPFAVGVIPEGGSEDAVSFTDRAEWLAEHRRRRDEIEQSRPATAAGRPS